MWKWIRAFNHLNWPCQTFQGCRHNPIHRDKKSVVDILCWPEPSYEDLPWGDIEWTTSSVHSGRHSSANNWSHVRLWTHRRRWTGQLSFILFFFWSVFGLFFFCFFCLSIAYGVCVCECVRACVLRVLIPAGVAGEFSSPGSTFCADSYFGICSTHVLSQ